MEQLFIMAAKVMPEEMMIKELSEALENYKSLHDEASKRKLTMYLMLLSTKFMSEGKDMLETMQDHDKFKRMVELFEDKNN